MICASLSLLQIMFVVHRFAQRAADWRSGPRWTILSVLCPVHPFPLRGTSPQGETRDMREKTASHILQVPFRRFSLWWLAPPPCPVGSVSLDSQSPTAPCESSSLATRWEACHWIRGSQSSPMNPVPLPPPPTSRGGRWCRKAPRGGKKATGGG